MKRRSIVISMLLVIALLLSACSTSDNDTDVVGEDPLKVVLLIPGNLGDKSFFDSANAGLELVKSELGAKTKVIEMGTDTTKWEPTFSDVSEEDWDIIISGNDTTELMNEMGGKYPEKRYINFDTFIEETADNVYAMFYSTNQVSFLAGALASMITTSDMEYANEENVIGFLGGMDIPGINDFLVGYIEGAKSVNEDVKVLVSYAGDFTDAPKGKELGLIQYRSGVDVSFNVAGGTGLGLMDAAFEQDAYAIGVDSDQAMMFKETDPDKADNIISSAVKRIDQAILNAVKKHLAGELEYGTHDELGVAEGAVGLAKNEYYETLPEDIKTKITEIEEKISNGEITVGTAFGVTTEDIEALRQTVKP